MGNIYYRHPRWRVSPYAGFGVGAFFHDGAFTSTVTLEDESGAIGFPTEPFRVTVAYEDSRFAYQIMGGLSVRASRLVAFRLGYRFRRCCVIRARGEPGREAHPPQYTRSDRGIPSSAIRFSTAHLIAASTFWFLTVRAERLTPSIALYRETAFSATLWRVQHDQIDLLYPS